MLIYLVVYLQTNAVRGGNEVQGFIENSHDISKMGSKK